MFQCVHCDEQSLLPIFSHEDHDHQLPFCCTGCLTVYEVLKEKSLTSYYDIKNSSSIFKRRSPVEHSKSSYAYLDDVIFQIEHSYCDTNENQVIDFFLEGIHCLACLWLIEKLPEIVKGVLTAKLDLEKSVVSITISKEAKFSSVARELDRLGYRPHPLKKNQDARYLQSKEERSYLKRLGIAGAAAGNIMIYSVSLYGGASDSMAHIFNILTVILAIPVFTYSAYPFYQSAWTAIKNKTVSIDIPISIALILGAVMGIRGLIVGFEENYFDSLTALVFLLLLSRYFLRKIQDRGLSATDLHYFYQNESVLKKDGEKFIEIHTRYIRPGDVLRVRRDEFIPADGLVLEGNSVINASLLTGESFPDHVMKGYKVFSGTQNMGDDLLIEVENTSQDTRLGKILKHVEQGWSLKSRTVDLTSEIAKYFTIVVIFLALGLFLFLVPEKGMSVALTRALTLLIVTCPCALAISIPLTFHRSLSQAAQNGVIVKSDEVFEKLGTAKNIFLDKTGTITLGQLQVMNFQSNRSDIFDIILTLEAYSRHPVGKALRDFARQKDGTILKIENFREIPGHGVEGRISSLFYEIHGGEVCCEGNIIANFDVRDGIRSDSREIIQRLKDSGFSVAILSGDKPEVVKNLASEAGILISNTFSSVSPEEKVRLVKGSHSVMIGDGANDAMALESADVGIAVSGAMDISLRASDVYLTTPGLAGVEKLFILSTETMKVVRRNLCISIIYNSLSIIFVFTGLISPMVAAIVMPVSSLTVLLSTLLETKSMRSLWKS